MSPALQMNNIETYYGPVNAIRGISLQVPKGAIIAVLGANGAGKSTILKTISGAMEPRKGSIEFDGQRIEGMEAAKVAGRGISHVPEGREVFRHLSVQDNLTIGGYLRRNRDEVRETLRTVYGLFPRLEERRRQHAGALSGGEQQMLAIGRAMMARPKMMLLDEPSLGLAPLLVKEMFEIIRRLNKEFGMTILLVEQNAHMALEVATFGYVLEVGRIVLEGTVEQLLENDDIKEFYLGIKDHGVRGRRRWKRKKMWR
jgi:branched-chain amino acid transport system ATP-binding protein